VECTARFRRKDIDTHIVCAHEAHIVLLDLLREDSIAPILVMLRHGLTEHHKFAAALAVQRIALTCKSKLDIVAADALPSLIQLLTRTGPLQVAATDALMALNLSKRAPCVIQISTVGPLIVALRGFSNTSAIANIRTKEVAISALTFLAGNSTNRNIIEWDDAIASLVTFLMDDQNSTLHEAAAVVFILLANNDDCTKTIVHAGATPLLVMMLERGSVAAACLLHKLSSSREHTMGIIRAGAILPLLAILEHDERRFSVAGILKNLGDEIKCVSLAVLQSRGQCDSVGKCN
jgi:hypothetical protein